MSDNISIIESTSDYIIESSGDDIITYVNSIDIIISVIIGDITICGIDPAVIITSDIVVDIVGVPRIGSSPLVVDFKASTILLGNIDGSYLVSEYKWYFDYLGNPDIYETTTVPNISHTYIGYSGKKYTIMLIAKVINIFKIENMESEILTYEDGIYESDNAIYIN